MVVYDNDTQSSWGARAIYDADDEDWNIFVSQMKFGCGLDSWKSNSEVVRARFDRNLQTFVFVEQVRGTFAHNPHITRTPDGHFVLFFIGGWNMEEIAKHCDGDGDGDGSRDLDPHRISTDSHIAWPNDGCGLESDGKNGGCGIAMAVSTSLNGPWEFSRLDIADQSRSSMLDCAHTNPR